MFHPLKHGLSESSENFIMDISSKWLRASTRLYMPNLYVPGSSNANVIGDGELFFINLIYAFVPQNSSNRIVFIVFTIQHSHIQQNPDLTFPHFVFSALVCTCVMVAARRP
jgi:hypothetical protein